MDNEKGNLLYLHQSITSMNLTAEEAASLDSELNWLIKRFENVEQEENSVKKTYSSKPSEIFKPKKDSQLTMAKYIIDNKDEKVDAWVELGPQLQKDRDEKIDKYIECFAQLLCAKEDKYDLPRAKEVADSVFHNALKTMNNPYQQCTKASFNNIFFNYTIYASMLKTYFPENYALSADPFSQKLKEKIDYYSSRADFFKQNSIEKSALYFSLNRIFNEVHTDYLLNSNKTDQVRNDYLQNIVQQVKSLGVSPKINQGRSIIAQALRGLKSIAIKLGLCEPDSDKLFRVSNYKDHFHSKSTQTVKDLVDVVEEKNLSKLLNKP